jgi:hypothetical protein
MDEGLSSTGVTGFLVSFFFCGAASASGSGAMVVVAPELSLAFRVAVLLRAAVLAILAATALTGSFETTQLTVPVASRDTT